MSEEAPGDRDEREGPTTGRSDEDAEALRHRCRDHRETMEPHETADCAGIGLVEQYENEEDGGS